tara:strand:- start:2866 stop:5160 length:2295 start_codon:yes stop_codon:yes gene_type:complete
MKKLSFFSLIFFPILNAQSLEIGGIVVDRESQTPLFGVNIVSGESGTTTDKLGQFELFVNFGDEVSFSFIGYKEVITIVKSNMIVLMEPIVLRGDQINVSANRAISGVTPVSFSNLSSKEIETRYTVEDVPMVLSTEPGIWAYSESGNGTGYSYVSIRGFDQSRIGVMIDGVPLNDNESHQVYWVDHGDILADAKNVQIQRGIGNSLYGASAFGGSINLNTQIGSDKREIDMEIGSGEWNTKKYRARYRSGKDLGEDISLTLRTSQIKSDGYRDFHNSKQNGFFLGLEHRGTKFTNQFRSLIGYENTQLAWDGIYLDDINDRNKRRAGYKAFTDDFLQQIYSVNTFGKLNDNLFFRNVSYFVSGKGYYESEKTDQDFYSYNLDVNNQYTDSEEQSITTDLLRRKWIVNNYFGIVPTLTWNNDQLRADFGTEIRFYSGDHFGEVANFTNSSLNSLNQNGWYRYYQYLGQKNSISSFAHFVWHPKDQPFSIMVDFQNQKHLWNLDQKKIGHAIGHNLEAEWDFFNPRIGMIWEITDSMNVFVNWGKAQKEPADNQIIQADDMWSKPIMAAAEVITDLEWGMDFTLERGHVRFNGYNIEYLNEQLKNIDVDQEGEYDYYSADSTSHFGFEWESAFTLSNRVSLSINGAQIMNYFPNGNSLPNIPQTLFNLFINYRPIESGLLFFHWRRVGHMYIDKENTEAGMIDPYGILNIGFKYQWKKLNVMLKINNALDKLYSTYGYSYEWDGYQAYYWPGATRNTYISFSYSF